VTVEAIATQPPPTPIKPRGRWFAVIAWLYAIATIIWWLAMRYAADRFWAATVLLFAPRWPMLLPLILLLPMALIFRPKSLRLLLVSGVLIAWPIMGLELNRLPRSDSAARSDLRVLTLNTHFQALDTDTMRALLQRERPDVIALQEWFGGNAKPIIGGNDDYPNFLATTGAFVASKYPIHFLQASKNNALPDDGVFYTYQIDYPNHPITFFNVHLASPHGSLSETLHGEKYGINRLRNNASARWNEAMRLRDLAEHADENVILAGDFNLPNDGPIFRNAFSNLSDAFVDAGLGYGWTYRMHRTNVRIDHILTGSAWSCRCAWVGPDVGSPHRPLIADFRWIGK
jgi:endonuclease/exonuclease/phosphatase (EEP) superfamily protein YafD